MKNDWFDAVKHNKLIEGDFSASIKVNCSPNTRLNLRPLITTKDEIEEWHFLISNPPAIDWTSVSSEEKPAPGSPIITSNVIRFHPDDVETSINVRAALDDIRATHEGCGKTLEPQTSQLTARGAEDQKPS